jgi:hypothetical protein
MDELPLMGERSECLQVGPLGCRTARRREGLDSCLMGSGTCLLSWLLAASGLDMVAARSWVERRTRCSRGSRPLGRDLRCRSWVERTGVGGRRSRYPLLVEDRAANARVKMGGGSRQEHPAGAEADVENDVFLYFPPGWRPRHQYIQCDLIEVRSGGAAGRLSSSPPPRGAWTLPGPEWHRHGGSRSLK